LTINYPDPKALPPAYGGALGAVTLATDYLTCLREHAVKILTLKLGGGVVDTTPLRYIITVPAIWDDAAKHRTQQCAINAGMGNDIRIISEPEAAVVHALDIMDPHNLKVGDTFVLCDAGGGTVDLISYSVTRLEPKVEIREAVAGSGDACGSIFLNRIFRKYLEEQLEDAEGVGDDTIADAMADFESTTKRKFTGEEKDVNVRVPGLADDPTKNIKRQKMTISSSTLKSLFEPVIASITILVKNQLKQTKKAKAVILVGGFGQSPYLRKCLEQVVGDTVEVLQPTHGWTAVVRGALIKALSEDVPGLSRITIASRVARKAYGMRLSVPYNQEKHEEERK
jgi:molecular chaperone DnaK (HSP70)